MLAYSELKHINKIYVTNLQKLRLKYMIFFNAHAYEFQTDILRRGIYFDCILYFPHQRQALN